MKRVLVKNNTDLKVHPLKCYRKSYIVQSSNSMLIPLTDSHNVSYESSENVTVHQENIFELTIVFLLSPVHMTMFWYCRQNWTILIIKWIMVIISLFVEAVTLLLACFLNVSLNDNHSGISVSSRSSRISFLFFAVFGAELKLRH